MRQKVFHGQGCLKKLVEILRKSGARNVLIFHGRASFESSGLKETLNTVEGINYTFCGDLRPNPEIQIVRRCLYKYKLSTPDVVIAIGGGSIIDTAKVVIAFASGSHEKDILRNQFSLNVSRPRFWAVPTTAGSGSEATHFAVLYKNSLKYSIANPDLKPDVVFLDPTLTLSCPTSLVLESGADAVCQAIESWWSKGATSRSRIFALQALALILENIFKVIKDPNNLDIRKAMLEGAHLAGKAINISKTTAGHALGYGLTSSFGVPHGLAVLSVMEFLVQLMDKQYHYFEQQRELDAIFKEYGVHFTDAFSKFTDRVYWEGNHAIFGKNGLAISQTKLLMHLVSSVNIERLVNHPVMLTMGDIEWLYKCVLQRLRSIKYIQF